MPGIPQTLFEKTIIHWSSSHFLLVKSPVWDNPNQWSASDPGSSHANPYQLGEASRFFGDISFWLRSEIQNNRGWMILNLTIVYLYFSFKLFYSFHSASGYLVVWVNGVDCLGTSINRRIPPITLPAFPTGVSGDSNHMGPHCRLYYIKSGWWFGTFGLFSISYMGESQPHWLSYCSRWLKPPTRSTIPWF
jgi:hypothetical protein